MQQGAAIKTCRDRLQAASCNKMLMGAATVVQLLQSQTFLHVLL